MRLLPFLSLTFALLAAANAHSTSPVSPRHHPHHYYSHDLQLHLHPRGMIMSIPSDSTVSGWEREQLLGSNRQRNPSPATPAPAPAPTSSSWGPSFRSARRRRRPGVISPPRFPPPEFVGPGPGESHSPGRDQSPLSTLRGSPWGSPSAHGHGYGYGLALAHGRGRGGARGEGGSTPRSASPKSDRMSWGDTGQESVPSWSTPGWLDPKKNKGGAGMAGDAGASASASGGRHKKKGGWAGRIKGCFAAGGGSSKSQCSQ